MKFGFVDEKNMSLLTDLYELTMAQAYFDHRMNGRAVFDFFARHTKKRSYLVSAGLEQLLYYLESLRFEPEEIDFLRQTGRFSSDFLDYLTTFRFTGDVYAVEEGEILFENEPFVRVEAPLIEAQIIETFLINTMQISILVATKALRCHSVAKGTGLVDFGLRRAHGTDAGMKAARSAYIGGFIGTSNVLAGKEFGLPIFGTMAHSFILAHDTEESAFEHFARSYPDNTILLVDTFDTIEGVRDAVKTVRKLGMKTFKGVRLDSGDILTLSKAARKILDDAGYNDAMVLVSGGLNEYKIKDLLERGAPIDAWGVGTELVVSADSPYLDCAYKLVEYEGRPKMKFSPGKLTLPAKKQIFREYRDGKIHKDTIALHNEDMRGTPLLRHCMSGGKTIVPIPSLEVIRDQTLRNFEQLPEELKVLESKERFKPAISEKLSALLEAMEKSTH
ncbi:nicotinate phosphoribosyltransferase [Hydrogenimonas urashimensis]|uniref:nicotinate phosphoribosyltransferase n=1 Tax=Hydrogenimonas urashimensis TaxID=2740515 RepID=UPI0019155519|nr:nicotinate phosphoribosyltransferase [Hydrogenimonas urashimensis]